MNDIENNIKVLFLYIVPTKHLALFCTTVGSCLVCYPHFVVAILMINLVDYNK